MSRKAVYVAVTLMAVGALGPWASGTGPGASATAGGLAHGGGVVLVCCACTLVAMRIGARGFAGAAAAVSFCWCVLAAYSLPGALLHNDVDLGQASVGWGLLLCLAASGLLVLVARLPQDRVAWREGRAELGER